MSLPKIPDNFEDQLREVAKLMVTGPAPFAQAARQVGLEWTEKECEKITRRPEFKRILREERNKVHTEVANTRGRNKSSAIGMMVLALENLMAEGEYDKVIAGIEKLAKLEGWVGPDSNINVFHGITAKDIEEQIKALESKGAVIKGSQAISDLN